MNENQHSPTRRDVMKFAAAGAATMMIGGKVMAEAKPQRVLALKGRINHSVCKWCYKMSLDDLAKNAKAMGLVGVDLLQPEEFATVKKYGLKCTMTMSHDIGRGINRKETGTTASARFAAASTRPLPKVGKESSVSRAIAREWLTTKA